MDRTLTRILLARSNTDVEDYIATQLSRSFTALNNEFHGWTTSVDYDESQPFCNGHVNVADYEEDCGCRTTRVIPNANGLLTMSYEDLLTCRCVDPETFGYIPNNGTYINCKSTSRLRQVGAV